MTITAKISDILQKCSVTLLTICSHSMTAKRVISHYNQIKTYHTICLLKRTINYRSYVPLNGIRTAYYDPRPAVIAFLNKHEMRYREPYRTKYKHCNFISKFFSINNDFNH